MILILVQSDAGGPLVIDGVLVGIASADFYCGTRPNDYGIYTKVLYYNDFIAEVMEQTL